MSWVVRVRHRGATVVWWLRSQHADESQYQSTAEHATVYPTRAQAEQIAASEAARNPAALCWSERATDDTQGELFGPHRGNA